MREKNKELIKFGAREREFKESYEELMNTSEDLKRRLEASITNERESEDRIIRLEERVVYLERELEISEVQA